MKNAGNLKVTTPSDREIRVTRTFAAPRELVYRALTRPELLKRWCYGPDDWLLAEVEMDVREGGTFRYLWRGADGTEMGMHGVFREVVPPERIVHTEEFEDPSFPGESVITTSLTEQNGKTTLTCTMLYDSKVTRDSVLNTPMTDGMAVSYDRMADVIASLQ